MRKLVPQFSGGTGAMGDGDGGAFFIFSGVMGGSNGGGRPYDYGLKWAAVRFFSYLPAADAWDFDGRHCTQLSSFKNAFISAMPIYLGFCFFAFITILNFD